MSKLNTKNLPNFLSYAEHEIARHQLQTQKEYLKQNHDLVKAELGLNSSDYHWRLTEELRKHLYYIEVQEKELSNYYVRKKTLWDMLKIRIYKWAMKGRLYEQNGQIGSSIRM